MTICGDGVRMRAVRIHGGIRMDVLDPDPRTSEADAVLLASFDCPLVDLLRVTSGRRFRAENGGKSLEISIVGPLVEVRYGPGDGIEHSCETFRRDYFDALIRLCRS